MPIISIGQTTGSPQDLKVATLTNGNWVAVWNAQTDPDGSRGVYYQVFDQTGASVTAIKRAHTNYTGDQREQQVASLSAGGFAITWTSSPNDIFLSIFDGNGGLVASEVRGNIDPGGERWTGFVRQRAGKDN